MNLRKVSWGVLAGFALASLCMVASANAQSQSSSRARAPAVSLSEANAARNATPAPRRGLRLNDSGRWGLDLNLSEPVGRERELGDVEAGAYYRVNPRLRVGASAGLASPEPDPAEPVQTDRRTAPRFRLESIFRF